MSTGEAIWCLACKCATSLDGADGGCSYCGSRSWVWSPGGACPGCSAEIVPSLLPLHGPMVCELSQTVPLQIHYHLSEVGRREAIARGISGKALQILTLDRSDEELYLRALQLADVPRDGRPTLLLHPVEFDAPMTADEAVSAHERGLLWSGADERCKRERKQALERAVQTRAEKHRTRRWSELCDQFSETKQCALDLYGGRSHLMRRKLPRFGEADAVIAGHDPHARNDADLKKLEFCIETLRKDVQRAIYEVERSRWIREHLSKGLLSERLERIYREPGLLVYSDAVYRDERLEMERPGWCWRAVLGELEILPPRNPPASAFRLLDEARQCEPSADLCFFRGRDSHGYLALAPTQFLDREIAFVFATTTTTEEGSD